MLLKIVESANMTPVSYLFLSICNSVLQADHFLTVQWLNAEL